MTNCILIAKQRLSDSELVQSLTNTEYEVFLHIALGMSNKEIAGLRGVAVKTIETHRERIMKKLDIHSAVSLAHFALFHKCIRNPYEAAAQTAATT